MNQRCHSGSGLIAVVTRGVLEAFCAACGMPVTSVHVIHLDDHLEPQCHPGAPVTVWYSDGKLTVRCAVCGASVATVDVQSKATFVVSRRI